MRKLILVLMSAPLAMVATVSRADMWRCEEPNGSTRFTNIQAEAKGCKLISVSPPNVVSVPAQKGGATPGGFPKVDPKTQAQRDNDRRKILENELANEERNLATAKAELIQQESVRTGDEKNYQRVLDRLEPFQKRVKLHEDNVANLRKEINNLR
jgi:predicted pyridoxine 5'-phosphate oxidase superfamily flavin-nucleotide-binding protein